MITTLRMAGPPTTTGYSLSIRLYVRIMFGLIALLSVATGGNRSGCQPPL
jgi:hypothetical protein